MINQIKEWIKTCPLLKKYQFTDVAKVTVDSLDVDSIQYTIIPNPVTPVVQEFIDGSKIRQMTFDFRSQEKLNVNQMTNIENSQFYEQLSLWIAQKNIDGLPFDWVSAEAVSNGYLFDSENDDNGIYTITINIQYLSDY